MGADNISYIAVFPNPIPKKNIAAARKYLKELKQFLDSLTIDDVKKINDCTGSATATMDIVLDICKAHGLKFRSDTNWRIASGLADIINDEGGFIEQIPYPDELDVDPPYGIGYRDTASRCIKIGRKSFKIVSCGEMSWGDEPSGHGYTELKHAFRWGVISLLGGQ